MLSIGTSPTFENLEAAEREKSLKNGLMEGDMKGVIEGDMKGDMEGDMVNYPVTVTLCVILLEASFMLKSYGWGGVVPQALSRWWILFTPF